MITNDVRFKLPTCILCRSEFDEEDRQPCTQVCHHSICMRCILESGGSIKRCSLDDKEITLKREINFPLMRLFSRSDVITTRSKETIPSANERIGNHLEELAVMLKSDLQNSTKPKMSPQLRRLLLHLLESTYIFDESRILFVTRLSSVFKRLLIELIQAHSNTKQREVGFRRLVKGKGCTLHPDLTDCVIDILIKLYNGSGQCDDTSFERKVLIKFCQNKLPRKYADKKSKTEVERVIQALYFSGCFHVTKGENQPSRYRLKDESYEEVRLKYDLKFIKLAQEEYIRLSPGSWAHLLYEPNSERSYPEAASRLQSLLDKHQIAPSFSELEHSMKRAGNICRLSHIDLENLSKIETLVQSCQKVADFNIELEALDEAIQRLYQARGLFVLRQCR